MTIIPMSGALLDENESAVKLARYAQLASTPECFVFGVADPDTPETECNRIWSYEQRAMLAKYLKEAQDEIEQVVNYPLSPRWFSDEQHPYTFPIQTTWRRLIAMGVKASSNIGLAQAVDHTTDPAVVGPLATTVTSIDEIKVYHPGTEIEIVPSSVLIAMGAVTIELPRCRLVTQAAQLNTEVGIDYTDTAPGGPFEQTVDVVRVYNDATDQGELVFPHQSSECGCVSSCPSCGEYTHAACGYIQNAVTGAVNLLKATLTGGVLVADSCLCACRRARFARVNYKAGLVTLTMQAEDAIIRLAHAKMPSEPCGCGPIQLMWKRDRNTPDGLSAERLNCPFGLSDGAWVAWRFANAMISKRMHVL